MCDMTKKGNSMGGGTIILFNRTHAKCLLEKMEMKTVEMNEYKASVFKV